MLGPAKAVVLCPCMPACQRTHVRVWPVYREKEWRWRVGEVREGGGTHTLPFAFSCSASLQTGSAREGDADGRSGGAVRAA